MKAFDVKAQFSASVIVTSSQALFSTLDESSFPVKIGAITLGSLEPTAP
jgi:hypothetical protein